MSLNTSALATQEKPLKPFLLYQQGKKICVVTHYCLYDAVISVQNGLAGDSFATQKRIWKMRDSTQKECDALYNGKTISELTALAKSPSLIHTYDDNERPLYDVEVHFVKKPIFRAQVSAINKYQAVCAGVKASGCSSNEMYSNESNAKLA